MFVWHVESTAQLVPVVVITVFTLLAGLAVAARVRARHLQRLALGANDYVMLVAMILTCGLYGCGLLGILLGGLGLHEDTIVAAHPEAVTTFGILLFAAQLLWPLVQGLVKVSMCLLYIAIFPQPRFRIVSTLVLTICGLFSVAIFLATLLICIPVSAWWLPSTAAGACGDRVALWLWSGILNLLTDAMVIYLPMPMVWKLYIPTGKKLMLTSLFGVGALVTATSIIRLHSVLTVDFSTDTTYNITRAATWSFVETTLGIFTGCLPVMGPTVRNLLPSSVAQRWTYARQSPDASASFTRRSTPDRRDEEVGPRPAARGWYGMPCSTRVPTPHPILSVANEPAKQCDKDRMTECPCTEEDHVIDSMVRGEGIMVKVEWEVKSERSSWPMSRREKKNLSISTSEEMLEMEETAESPGASLSLAFPMM